MGDVLPHASLGTSVGCDGEGCCNSTNSDRLEATADGTGTQTGTAAGAAAAVEEGVAAADGKVAAGEVDAMAGRGSAFISW